MSKKKDILICRCEEVTKKEIEDAIEGGADTIDGIKRSTRAAMGLCQGRTCHSSVARILRDKTGRPLKEIYPATFRPPLRTVTLDIIAKEGERILGTEEK